MSVYGRSYQAAIDQAEAGRACLVEASAEFPLICEVLSGIPTGDGKGWFTWPATLMIFLEAGKVKFCVSPQQGSQVAFGCVKDLSKGLQSIEAALDAGEFEWKRRKGRSQS